MKDKATTIKRTKKTGIANSIKNETKQQKTKEEIKDAGVWKGGSRNSMNHEMELGGG